MPKIRILHQHNDFVIAIKPQNTAFHDSPSGIGFFNRLSQQLEQALWPVHRLDNMTCGLIVVAKTQSAAAEFGRLFNDRAVDKTYLALSDKKPKKKQGLVKGDMKPARKGDWKLMSSQSNPAITRFYSRSLVPGIRIYWVKPLTGKTHQIRVALKSIGAPILGDSRYGGSSADRGYLCAYRLAFEWQGQRLQWQQLPEEGDFFRVRQLAACIEDLEAS